MKYLKPLAALSMLLLTVAIVQAQFFTLPGAFFFSLNSTRQVFDISPDGKLAVALRNDPNLSHPALLSSFDPILGTTFDSKTFGFGPLGVQLAQTAVGLRVVVLTSQGGPRQIFLFDLSSTGQLTQLGSTQLTTSNADAGSNIVLSGSAQVGFALVNSNNGSTGVDLVTFSLIDGAIVSRLAVGGDGTLAMTEAGGKRLLTFFKGTNQLEVVDATDVLNPVKLADVPFPANNEFSGDGTGRIAISGDGRFAFVADEFADFAVIDLVALQTISTLGGPVRYSKLRLFEDSQRKLLALQTRPAGAGGQPAILLIDATDPFHLSNISQLNLGASQPGGHFGFSKDASRFVVASSLGLTAYSLPEFTKVWEQPLPDSLPMQVITYGPTDEVLAAWLGSGAQGFPSTFGAFPFNPPTVSVSDAVVNEGDSGTVNANFSVTLSSSTNHRLTVSYTSADGTAVLGTDYSNATGAVVFEPGETGKTLTVTVLGDTLDEFDETFSLNLKASPGILTRNQVTATILDDDSSPSASISDAAGVVEGNSGTRNAFFLVTLSAPSGKPISMSYSVTDGTATSGDYVNTPGTVSFTAGQTTSSILVPVVGDTVNEPDETFFVTLANPSNVTLDRAQASGTILNDDTPLVRFALAASTFAENAGSGGVVVTRRGDTSSPATIDYATSDNAGANNCNVIDGKASSRCDYETTAGTLRFTGGEVSKTIPIPIIDDSYAEGSESFTIALSNPTGTSLGVPNTATINITDNESTNGANPVDQAGFFVRQHYIDFLNREPDAAGLAFWSNQITECEQPGVTCSAEMRRINVSAAFFLSIEFQETGYLVYRIYKASYGNITGTPVPVRLIEFLPDTQQIGKDVVIGQPGAEQQLESNKVAFALDFVSRSRFVNAYPTTLTPGEFVDALFTNAGVTPSASERSAAIDEFAGAGNTANTAARGRALRRVAENSTLKQQETNKAFVLMQYLGYLRRNPNDPPEANLDFGGYNFWLGKLNEFNGNFVNAEMVKAFLVSGEYRQRFGP